MTINLRSLRIRLFLLYVVFALISMICLGFFSYWYLSEALASSRQHTMEARENRIAGLALSKYRSAEEYRAV